MGDPVKPLNSSLEVGLRVLFLLAEAHPMQFDLSRLVLLDYALLHSGDLDGPASVHPPVPLRQGELGVKRRLLNEGLEVLLRTGLAEMSLSDSGLLFGASESAPGFLALLQREYARALRARASWVIQRFGDLPEDRLRIEMRRIQGAWSEEFHSLELTTTEGGGR
jgi:hypothetical protein